MIKNGDIITLIFIAGAFVLGYLIALGKKAVK